MQLVFDKTSPVPFLGKPVFLIGLLFFCLCLGFWIHSEVAFPELKMEKSSGKNEKHANQKVREIAEEAYQKAKQAFEQLLKKPNKTPDDKKLLKKLQREIAHWRKKKDWTGENHSQKNKGN